MNSNQQPILAEGPTHNESSDEWQTMVNGLETERGNALDEAQKEIIQNTLEHPAFAINDEEGLPFYNADRLEELYSAISGLMQRIESEHVDSPIPERIETILAEDEENFKFYSGLEDLSARTAYGLLCGEKKGSNCAGFSEVCCILLNLYGYEAAPALSRLSKKWNACHYITLYRDQDGMVKIIDPERKRACSEPEKQYNLTTYQLSLRYAAPDGDFCINKVAPNGLTPNFDEFFVDKRATSVRTPIDKMSVIADREGDGLGLFKDSSRKRLNFRKSFSDPGEKAVLEHAISETLEPIYEASLDMATH